MSHADMIADDLDDLDVELVTIEGEIPPNNPALDLALHRCQKLAEQMRRTVAWMRHADRQTKSVGEPTDNTIGDPARPTAEVIDLFEALKKSIAKGEALPFSEVE